MKNKKLRLGLIGAGKWGKNYIKTIKKSDCFDLVSLSSRNPDIRKTLDSNCKLFYKWEDLIAYGKIDGLIISSPPSTHFEIITKALRSQIPIIVEKPLTINSLEANQIFKLANTTLNSPIVLVDHIYLYDPIFRLLEKKSKEYGSLIKINSIGGSKGPFRKDVRALWDWAPHDISMCLSLLGKMPDSVKAKTIKKDYINGQICELINIELNFENSLKAEMLIGNLMEKKNRYFILEYENFKLKYEQEKNRFLKEYSKKRKIENLLFSDSIDEFDLPLDSLLKEFGKAILLGKKKYQRSRTWY